MSARTNMGRILARRGANLAARGTPVTLRWRPVTGPVDPVTGAATLGEEETETVIALMHTVSPGAHSVRLFAEIETGDLLLDLAPDVNLGRPGLVFEVGGRSYVQKPLGDRLAPALDARVRGQDTFQTVLLRLQT